MEFNAQLFTLIQDNIPSVLSVLGLSAMRPLGMLFGFIAISWAIEGASLIRTALAFAIAIPVIVGEGPVMAAAIVDMKTLQLSGLYMKELAIGYAFGFALSVPFWVVQYAGHFIDSYRGENNPGAPDPTGGEISTISKFLLIVAFLVFASVGGFWIMTDAFYKTYTLWPITKTLPGFTPETPKLILGLMDQLLRLSIILAAPIMFLMVAIDFVSLICGKIARGFNATELSFILKNVLTLFLLPLIAILLVHILKDGFLKNFDIINQIKTFIP